MLYPRSHRLLLYAALFILTACNPAGQAGGPALVVTRVVDGDTFELSDGRKVRLIGVDTPEKWSSQKLDRDAAESGQSRATIQALGKRASEHSSKLVLGKPVELEFEPSNAASDHQDRYGRTLAYVWVLGADGRRSFMANERLIADGFANAYTSYPFSKMDAFRAAERSAREAGRGLWAEDALQAETATEQPVKKVQCKGTTRSGKRCTRMTTDPDGYCWQHKPDATPSASTE